MLQKSDRGYIVVDDRRNRSMQDFITSHGASNGLYQLNLLPPGHANGNFYHAGIRVGTLDTLWDELSGDNSIHKVYEFCTSRASAAVLATQSRRSDLSGPSLQAVHHIIGRYLAERLLDEFTDCLTGTDTFRHVQGTTFTGVCASCRVLIIPLMRGGEPMARGVFECFPDAQLFHYPSSGDSMSQKETDALQKLLASVEGVILVDSVVNEGRSLRRVIRHLHTLSSSSSSSNQPRLFVLTGVMQKQASLQLPLEFRRIRFLALRVSENKFTGHGGTDTGNRLFGTVDMK